MTSDVATLTVATDAKLLIHCDGTDGSQSFYDSSPSGHTITAYGQAQVDTGVVKFGSGSLLLDGNGDYLFWNDRFWN